MAKNARYSVRCFLKTVVRKFGYVIGNTRILKFVTDETRTMEFETWLGERKRPLLWFFEPPILNSSRRNIS